MGLGVYCECGTLIPVLKSQAEGAVHCPCGFRVVVPALEEFQDRSHLVSAASIERRVQRLIDAGVLPQDGGSVECGSADSAAVVSVKIDCKKFTIHRSGGDRFLLLPFITMFVWITWKEEKRIEIRGRDTEVAAPIRLCELCRLPRFHSKRMKFFGVIASLVLVTAMVSLLDVTAGIGAALLGLIGISLWRRIEFRSRQKALQGVLRKGSPGFLVGVFGLPTVKCLVFSR